MNRVFLIAGALLMAFAVGMGAFGAHALKQKLTLQMMTVYKTAVEYHFYHAIGLLMIGILMNFYHSAWISASGWIILSGTILFSGSLYLLSITDIKWLGVITPVGGIFFIAGWMMLVVEIIKDSSQ